MVAVNLSRQEELDPDRNAIPKIELVGKLNKTNGVNVESTESMLC